MSDLFEFGRAADPMASSQYGASGDMKKTQYVLQLLGFPADAGTLKCLVTAVEMGMETDCEILDITAGAHEASDYLEISPFGAVPALKEADYIVTGEMGIMSFIEARGLGRRLPPKNAGMLANQDYWSDLACSEADPHVKVIVEQCILGPMQGRECDDEVVEEARKALAPVLDALDWQLVGRDFVIGDYSFADIHWTVYIHLLYEAGEGELVNTRANIKTWFNRIRVHKSYCGQDIIAYNLLPTLEDMKNKRLNSVEMSDF